MATLGQLAATLQDHENRLLNHDQGLNGAAAERANLDARLTAMESGIMQKIMNMITKEHDKIEKLEYKAAKDCAPAVFMGEKNRFRSCQGREEE